jgi:mRNA (2'-O-methyladenosine-N6-)-methyltransferase
MEYCKFVHYKIDEIDEIGNASFQIAKNQADCIKKDNSN